MSNLGRFNTQLENLLNDLIKSFPDFIDIKMFKEKFLLAKKVNPKLVLLIFLKYIYPYKTHIVEQNVKFFLDDSLTSEFVDNEELQKEGNVDNEYILTKALNFKKMWSKMSDQQKQTVWIYFKVLVVLCERYVKESMG